MPVRTLPVRPDLDQLHRQAKDLLRAIHAGEHEAIAELREHHLESIDPAGAKLADAHLVLARSYRASSWTRLVHAVQLADAIWRDEPDNVEALITRNSALIHEHVLIRTDSGWGPPMTYAANLGRDHIHAERRRNRCPACARSARRRPRRGGLEHHGASPRHRQPEPIGQTPHPRDVRRARVRASRHAGHGAPSRTYRSA